MDFLDANKALVSACRRHLRTTDRGLPQWCSPSNALRQTTTFEISSMSPQWGRKSNIVTTSIFLYTRLVYQNYNLQKATNTNRGKIDGVCLVLATKDINIPLHACGSEKVGLHGATLIKRWGVRWLALWSLERKIRINWHVKRGFVSINPAKENPTFLF